MSKWKLARIEMVPEGPSRTRQRDGTHRPDPGIEVTLGFRPSSHETCA